MHVETIIVHDYLLCLLHSSLTEARNAFLVIYLQHVSWMTMRATRPCRSSVHCGALWNAVRHSANGPALRGTQTEGLTRPTTPPVQPNITAEVTAERFYPASHPSIQPFIQRRDRCCLPTMTTPGVLIGFWRFAGRRLCHCRRIVL